jgi:hypothetical protein
MFDVLKKSRAMGVSGSVLQKRRVLRGCGNVLQREYQCVDLAMF